MEDYFKAEAVRMMDISDGKLPCVGVLIDVDDFGGEFEVGLTTVEGLLLFAYHWNNSAKLIIYHHPITHI